LIDLFIYLLINTCEHSEMSAPSIAEVFSLMVHVKNSPINPLLNTIIEHLHYH